MDFTAEQKNALEAQGRTLVSAAAGSGKTAVLVEKVINLVTDEDNPVDIDKLLIVTFTNAAAAEMKTRIGNRLQEKLKSNPENFNLKRQKLLLNSAPICTIDSLCISLSRDYFYKLGIPCDFKIADSGVISKLQNDCIDGLIAEKFEKSDEDFLNLVSVFGGERADEKLKENIFKVYGYLCSLPFPEIYIDKVNSIYSDFDEKSVLFDVVFDYAAELIKNSSNAFSNAYSELLEDDVLLSGYGESFAEVDAKLKRAYNFVFARDYDGIRNMLEHYENARLKSVRNYSDIEFREKMKAAKKKAESVFSSLKKIFNCSLQDIYDDMNNLAPIVKKFLSLTMEFSERLYNAKKENNCFGFADIEAEVLKLLVKYEGGKIFYTDEARELSQKYYSVLVDEYQDTNDLQNTIFNALSDDGKKLFMVGDVKQSIYGFRKANPKNFLNSRNELPLYEKGSLRSKVVMSGNFRSSEPVCDFVNFVFYKLLSDKCGEMFYEEEDMLVPKAEFQSVPDSRVNFHIINAVDDYTPTERQAYHIVNIINEKINGEPCITDKGALRKAEYKDFCILLRSKGEISVFNDILRENKIPVTVDDNDGLLLEKEVVTLFSLLQVIDNPYSDIPLLSTLTGDMFRFNADEIAKIRAENKSSELFRALLAVKNENQKVADFIECIEEFRTVAAMSSVSKLISKVLSATGYDNTVFMYENGELCYRNLLLFKEAAKSFEESTGRGLSAFIGYIKRQIKNGNTMQKATASGENDNAVKIMTMHRSKGLQFPICILACLNKKFNRKDSSADVVMTEKCGLGLNFIDKNRKIKYSTFPRNACVIENNAVSQSEEMRLLYVAMTRAKDYLYMIGAEENAESFISSIADEVPYEEDKRFNPYFVQSCDTFLKMLIACALTHKDGEILRDSAEVRRNCISRGNICVKLIDDIENKESATETPENQELDEQKYKDLCEILNYKYRYKDLNKIFVKQSASAIAHKEISSDFAFKTEPIFLNNQKLSAAEKGTAMHKFMQFCDLKSASESIDKEKNRLESIGKLTKAEAESLKEENLKAFFDSEIGKKIINNDSVFREQGFMVEVPAKVIYDDLGEEYNDEKVIIQGSADLCFLDGDGVFIIDYKTDRADGKELIKRYKSQLDVYAVALSQIFEKKVTGTAIYSFYNKKLITL